MTSKPSSTASTKSTRRLTMRSLRSTVWSVKQARAIPPNTVRSPSSSRTTCKGVSVRLWLVALLRRWPSKMRYQAQLLTLWTECRTLRSIARVIEQATAPLAACKTPWPILKQSITCQWCLQKSLNKHSLLSSGRTRMSPNCWHLATSTGRLRLRQLRPIRTVSLRCLWRKSSWEHIKSLRIWRYNFCAWSQTCRILWLTILSRAHTRRTSYSRVLMMGRINHTWSKMSMVCFHLTQMSSDAYESARK